MPHCIVEYSKTLESRLSPASLVNAAHQGALASGLFQGPDIKTRAIAYENYQVGDTPSDFIHVSVRLLNGRTTEQKRSLSMHILEQLQSFNLSELSCTVEVLDIDSLSYSKFIS